MPNTMILIHENLNNREQNAEKMKTSHKKLWTKVYSNPQRAASQCCAALSNLSCRVGTSPYYPQKKNNWKTSRNLPTLDLGRVLHMSQIITRDRRLHCVCMPTVIDCTL